MLHQLIPSSPEIIHEIIEKQGWFPNNSKLPLLLYKHSLNLAKITAEAVEELFTHNYWQNPWRNGIYPFHHYHSNTHEVLGIYAGACKVQIGGNQGRIFYVEKGDVLIIPAGVSHKNVGATPDFQCVGAYPFDIAYDMKEGKEEEYALAREQIQKVPLPKTDPVYGRQGPLFDYWNQDT